MENLRVFKNEEFGQVRTIGIDGNPYFVAKDVANSLGYSNPRDAISRHCKGVVKHDSFKEGGQEVALIPEGDIYRLIIKSKLPTAEKFERWVFDEVLPSIRKNGGYISGQENMSDEELLAKAVLVAQNKIAERDRQIQEMQPKADYFDALVDKKLNTNIRDTSKELCIKEREFTKFLEDKGFIFRQGSGNMIRPYAQYTESGKGLFTIKDRHCKKTGWVGQQVFITPKGKETFRMLLENR